MAFTFYWHDYETWGANPFVDRAAQFAGIRTDRDLNVVDKPLTIFCRPADDMLPEPEACLVTGITPQQAWSNGVNESSFFGRIHEQLSLPGTCGVGYNSIRFDDEFTRFGFYRNFIDPYSREWKHGNSRWDIIDMLRLAHAVRPEGIEWPHDENGVVSFRLEHLTSANAISHEGAHDALSDVYATLDLARLVKKRQPRLFEYLLGIRDKRHLRKILDPVRFNPLLHVSSMYPARLGCIAMVVPIAHHPINQNGIIVYDLRYDPDPLFGLTIDEIRTRLFTPAKGLPEGIERIPLKTVHLNKAPVVAPMNTLTDEAAARWDIDVELSLARVEKLRAISDLPGKIQAVHQPMESMSAVDPDQNLYGGGFFSEVDRQRIARVRTTQPSALKDLPANFDDKRLPELFFRYRARNWPETLSNAEKVRWKEFCWERLTNPKEGGGITLATFRRRLAQLVVASDLSASDRLVLSELADWPSKIGLGSQQLQQH